MERTGKSVKTNKQTEMVATLRNSFQVTLIFPGVEEGGRFAPGVTAEGVTKC